MLGVNTIITTTNRGQRRAGSRLGEVVLRKEVLPPTAFQSSVFRPIVLALMLPLWLLAGCVAPGLEPGPEAPPEVVETAPAPQPLPGLDPQQRFREVLMQLEAGEPEQARAELAAYLEEQPGSEVGADLLRQIDLPPSEYFPADYRDIELASGESLSTLARQYLGSVYQFYALAKYNGIAEPGKLQAGQAIRIPLTDYAREVFVMEDDPGAVAEQVEPVDMPQPTAEEEQAQTQLIQLIPVNTSGVSRIEAASLPQPAGDPDALHRKALDAYRAQDLDLAIELWDEVLTIDPSHESARLYRAQAVELQNRLRRLN